MAQVLLKIHLHSAMINSGGSVKSNMNGGLQFQAEAMERAAQAVTIKENVIGN